MKALDALARYRKTESRRNSGLHPGGNPHIILYPNFDLIVILRAETINTPARSPMRNPMTDRVLDQWLEDERRHSGRTTVPINLHLDPEAFLRSESFGSPDSIRASSSSIQPNLLPVHGFQATCAKIAQMLNHSARQLGVTFTCEEMVFSALKRKCGSRCMRKAFNRASVNFLSIAPPKLAHR